MLETSFTSIYTIFINDRGRVSARGVIPPPNDSRRDIPLNLIFFGKFCF
jgi:hypothetical protein